MISISLDGWSLLILLMVAGGWYGWRHGMRSFLTITLVSAVAYMILVNGIAQIFDYLDNLYMNLPKLFTIFTGGNPDVTAAWEPLGLDLGLSLQVRIVLFIVLLAFSFYINKKTAWYAAKPGNPQAKQLGIFTGALTALMWTSAVTTFWRESIADGSTALPELLDNLLNVFPDVTSVTPWLITVFFLMVIIGMVLNIPKLWKA